MSDLSNLTKKQLETLYVLHLLCVPAPGSGYHFRMSAKQVAAAMQGSGKATGNVLSNLVRLTPPLVTRHGGYIEAWEAFPATYQPTDLARELIKKRKDNQNVKV